MRKGLESKLSDEGFNITPEVLEQKRRESLQGSTPTLLQLLETYKDTPSQEVVDAIRDMLEGYNHGTWIVLGTSQREIQYLELTYGGLTAKLSQEGIPIGLSEDDTYQMVFSQKKGEDIKINLQKRTPTLNRHLPGNDREAYGQSHKPLKDRKPMEHYNGELIAHEN